MKNKIGLSIVSLLLTGMIYYIYSTNRYIEILSNLKNLDRYWFLYALLSIILYWLIEAKIINNIVKEHEGKQKYIDAIKVSMIGQFFSGITPFATGGQPAQLVIMTNQKISVGKSSSTLMCKFIVYQGTLVIYSAILLLLKTKMFINSINNMFSLVIMGFGINAVVICLLIFFSMSKKTNNNIAIFFINLLYRMKLIKNKQNVTRKFKLHIEEFHKHVIILIEHKKILYKTIFLTILQLTLYFVIPYFIYRSFGLEGVSIINIVAATAFVLMITSFIPMPGGTGAAEGGFYMMFGIFFLSKYILSAIVIWRFLTYYAWILIGGIWMLLSKPLKV